MDEFKYSFIAGTLGQTADRYLRTGYKESPPDLVHVIRKMAASGQVGGVELHYRGNETLADEEALREVLQSEKLKVSYVNAWLYGERKWMYGSLTAPDRATRQNALQAVKNLVDYARRVGGGGISLWLGQDGFDYAFQTDYRSQWSFLIEALREIGDYADGLAVALEPKPREPRNFLLVDSVPTALLICLETGCKNIGLTVDMGHVLYGRQNIAQHLEIAGQYGKLFNVHANDNYTAWDDDMVVGSVHLLEFLEAFYILKKRDYNGWISVDIFPYREDAFTAVDESIMTMRTYSRAIDRLGVESIDRLIAAGHVADTLKAIREKVFA